MVNPHVPLTQQIGGGSFIKEEVSVDRSKKKKKARVVVEETVLEGEE